MKESTSLTLFNKYISLNPTDESAEQNSPVNVDSIFSSQCYLDWLMMKKIRPKRPAEAFRKALTGHVRGDNGLHPFTPAVEEAVLKVLRRKKIWTCFKGTKLTIGIRGFNTLGFWEKQQKVRRRTLVPTKKERYQTHLRRRSVFAEQTPYFEKVESEVEVEKSYSSGIELETSYLETLLENPFSSSDAPENPLLSQRSLSNLMIM